MFLRSSFLTVALVVGAWSGAAAAQSPSSEPCFGEYTVTKAVPYRAPVRHGQGTYDQLVGARLYVPAKPGLTGEWLHAELARRANQPRAGTECPLDVPDVNITVRSGGPGFWVGLSTEDTGDAKEVLRRARALTR